MSREVSLLPSPAKGEGGMVVAEVEKVLAGKSEVVELAVTALLAGGHLLLEDVPGVGKTTLARCLARALDCRFSRIQFTSDMLPSDVTGTSVFNPAKAEFQFRPGPIFSHVVLADEINRTSPRTQSALLEAMNERQVSVDGTTYNLDTPFFVIATQNPKELHGTYPLPESQLDRFLLSLSIGYPEADLEKEVISGRNEERIASIGPVLDREALLTLQNAVTKVAAAQELVDYVYTIIKATRDSSWFELGASPRAGIQLLKAARALALMRGRTFLIPDDIRYIAPFVLAHRLILKNSSQLTSVRIVTLARVQELLDSTQAP